MIKRIFSVVILSILTTIVSGCSINGSPEDLMRPPKLESNREQVKVALQEYLPQNAKLVIPPSNDKPSAIKFLDLDGDGKREAIIFYNLDLDENPLRALILKNENKKWNNKGELKILGQDLDKVFFKDIDGDGGLDIIIGSKVRYSLSKNLNIYSFKNGNIDELLESTYEHLVVEDLNNDGLAETILLKSNKEQKQVRGELYKYNQGKVEMMDEVNFENISEINSIKEGYIGENTQGVVISTTGIDKLLKIYILKAEDNSLVNVVEGGFIESEKVPNIEYVLPQDIDKDGIMEFAIPKVQKRNDEQIENPTSWLTEWYSWDGDKSIVLKKINYYDEISNFSFDFPLTWRENIIVTNSKKDTNIISDEEWIKVDYRDNSEKPKRYHLFTIYIYTDEGLKRKDHSKNKEEPVKILEDIDKNYFIVLGDDIKKEKIKN
ncbi:putative lipoprotein [Gottschalkia acidurici 9a]|uniref:Lipoprotein n=1 Tax=Gottschalkia acidurici (strain ATCC 7906 / DSM 604 / BCRC 14475 / CIP 104303 / KCTC 5404 / NCIMB 10678 / 9a) TaxID=1128398 RepID=K0AXJ1_GOTA9|nr:VCBS repeat-containing protein [Gottschalkia acidurici]AFS77161.1 putative lipoprotein [Gottschalkia acidurici 9a]